MKLTGLELGATLKQTWASVCALQAMSYKVMDNDIIT